MNEVQNNDLKNLANTMEVMMKCVGKLTDYTLELANRVTELEQKLTEKNQEEPIYDDGK